MGKISLLLLGIFVSIVTGCMGGDEENEHPISAGIWEPNYHIIDPSISRSQFNFGRDGSYHQVNYYDGCAESEGMGNYRVSKGVVYLFGVKMRDRDACDSTFGAYEAIPDSKSSIRSITDTSFQTFEPPSSEVPGYWVDWKKL